MLARAIADVAGADVERLPVTIGEHGDFVALNAARKVACVDETRSVFSKWTKDDHRPDLAGHYRSIGELHLSGNMVPGDAHFFRVEGWPVGLIVSATVKDAMEQARCVGAKFIDVT
jgi:hypothetical protein